ncbi:hypothetical protein VP1G_10661 [Cytospora mali]|uniref:Uncharacterized protein n=1 Tax=Cytospora mali TaxID=578113 RepID=A0A194USB0_CYTMA|nr:hypothetical protein VP1G_10661 [Valsa mali var. pyri (nom. inval.)]
MPISQLHPDPTLTLTFTLTQIPQDPNNLPPNPLRQPLPILRIKIRPLAPPKHGKLFAPPPLGPDLRPRYHMEVHVRDDLGGRGAVVLHDVPVLHAGGPAQRRGQHAQVVSQLAGLAGVDVTELRGVPPRAEEEVAARERHDVEEGDGRARGEEEVGLWAGGG